MTTSTAEPIDKTLLDEPIIQLSKAQLDEFLAVWRLPTLGRRTVFLSRWLSKVTATFDTTFMDDPKTIDSVYTLLYKLIGATLP